MDTAAQAAPPCNLVSHQCNTSKCIVKDARDYSLLKMTTIQFVHLQPRYSYTKPPIRGPVTGPFIGPIDHIENARARWASSEISETVPGALAIIAAPKHALKYGQLDDMADTIIYHARYT